MSRRDRRASHDGDWLTFPDATVYVRSFGSGAPLLLINGLGAHTEMWRPLETSLDGFHVVEFDLPGAGLSPVPLRPVRIRRLARLCTAIMDRFDMPRADVVGYSMGGMVAQQLAAGHAERVRRLVLVATTPGIGSVQADARALFTIVTPMRYSSERLYARSIGSLVGGRARHDAAWVSEQSRVRFNARPTWRGYMGQMQSMAGWSALPILRNVEHPTLVLSGGDDPLAPALNGMIITHLMPQARLLVLEDEGHLLILDDRSVSHGAIRDFLTADTATGAEVWSQARDVTATDVRSALRAAPRQIPPLNVLDALARRIWMASA